MSFAKEKILDSVNRAREQGITLIADNWGSSERKCACPLGCLLLTSNENTLTSDAEDNAVDAAEILGVSEGWVAGFIYGFDGDSMPDYESFPVEAYRLGQTLRLELKPEIYGDYIASKGEEP